MAGGGSIPFEGLRFGFRTYANELNSVASVILKATLDYPTRFGKELKNDIQFWGKLLYERSAKRLKPFFSELPAGAVGGCYIWARTVACQVTGKPVPLSPNWWLQKGVKPVAVKLTARQQDHECRFQIVSGKAAIESNPDAGTVKKGVGKSPWTGDAVDGDYIKAEAQAGRMGQQLYAVAIKGPDGFIFRAPTDEDLAAVKAAEKELAKKLPDWEARGLVPKELRYEGPADRSVNYGIVHWSDCFSPRQLLSLLTFVDELHAMRPEIEKECGKEKAEAIATYLSFMGRIATHTWRGGLHSGK
jgi:adenine-specific DNA methylase